MVAPHMLQRGNTVNDMDKFTESDDAVPRLAPRIPEGGDGNPFPMDDGEGAAEKKTTDNSLQKPSSNIERKLASPRAKEPSDARIRRQMSKVLGTIDISDKGMASDLAKEEKYWEHQEMAFQSLVSRVGAGQKTLLDLASLLQKQKKACITAGKYLSLQGQWAELGKDDGLGMRSVCNVQNQLITGIGEYFEAMQPNLFEKPIAEAQKQAKEIGVFVARIQKTNAKLTGTIKKQRDLTNRNWLAYKSASAKRHKSFESGKDMRPCDDPYLAFEVYKRQVIALHKQQASYNSTMGQIMAEFETKECQRARSLRSLMLTIVSTQKAFFENAALICTQAIGRLSSVDLESDLLRFRHEGGLIHNPHTAEIDFKPKSMGMDFKNNRITQVKPGSQAHKLGIQPGWRILSINAKAAPASHQDIAKVLASLKKAGKPIKIRFGKKTMGMIFDQPPPTRSTQHIQILSNAELATVGDLSRMSKTMGFTSWTKMYCVITCSGVLHVLNGRDATSPHSSIQLHQSILRLAPKIDPFAFEIEETTQGFFGGGQKSHIFRTKTESALVDWVVEIKKFLRHGKTGIKETK